MNKNDFAHVTASIFRKMAIVLSGLILSLVVLEAGLRLGGFILSSMQGSENLRSIKQKGAYRILCLGESTTAGQYPHLLEQVLNRSNTGVRFSVIDKGRGAIDTNFLLSRVESYLAEYHPDMVVAMMGNNDKRIEYYRDIPEAETWIFRHCRVYRFGRILFMHFLKKLRKEDIYDSDRADLKRKPKLNDKGTAIEKANLSNLNGRKPTSAEEVLGKDVELSPNNVKDYVVLGYFYQERGKFSPAEDSYRKAIEINSANAMAYDKLGWLYLDQGKFSQAEDSFRKVIEITPRNDKAYNILGWLYQERGEFSQAEDTFKKSIEINPVNERLLGEMSSLYEKMGKPELAKEYAERANGYGLRSGYYPAITVSNYRKLKEILDRKGIKLVCVQYPMRNVAPLKGIFGKNEDVIFVDNESVFKEALKKGRFTEYFRDMFGGDFGHCTRKGNELLAQNIADMILKEVFNR